ncbi:MAG: FGGY-family carbohydrate kinase [Burkholderiaceae bacterium]|nr:FGGY-family carbohydrate kinase [Burkholderiaceae bacterium]
MAVDDFAVLALDLGSTWLKAGWVRPDGQLIALERVVSPLRADTINAQDVWQAVQGLLQTLCGLQQAPQKILALVLTGVTRSHVFVDAAGLPLAPVMLWSNPYGQDQAGAVARAFGDEQGTAGYGAFHPLARLLQFTQDHGAQPYAMVELKDWLNFRLTGLWATDAVAYGRITPAQASGLTTNDVLARLGFAASVVPAPALPTHILGLVQPVMAKSLAALVGVPVAVSSFDTWASTLGMGAVADESVYDVSGTTQVLGTFSRAPRTVAGMVSIAWTPELWQTGGPCQTGLGTLAWFAQAFLDSDDPADTLAAATTSSGVDLPICLPYLSGERMPWWSSTLSASFQQVNAQHRRCDFALALVEGLVLAHRLALDAMGARQTTATLYMDGGGTQHSTWVQARADAFGMPVRLSASGDSALTGAALAAGIGLGLHRDIATAQLAINASSTVVMPQAARVDYYDSRVKEFSTRLSRDLALL